MHRSSWPRSRTAARRSKSQEPKPSTDQGPLSLAKKADGIDDISEKHWCADSCCGGRGARRGGSHVQHFRLDDGDEDGAAAYEAEECAADDWLRTMASSTRVAWSQAWQGRSRFARGCGQTSGTCGRRRFQSRATCVRGMAQHDGAVHPALLLPLPEVPPSGHSTLGVKCFCLRCKSRSGPWDEADCLRRRMGH